VVNQLNSITRLTIFINGLISVKTHLPFCETWLRDVSLMPTFSGYKEFYSPLIPRYHSSTKFLPGSLLFVSSDLQPQQTNVCRNVAKDCSVFNVCRCLITCKARHTAIVSVYHSPSICIKSAVEDHHLVLQGLLPYISSFIILGHIYCPLLVIQKTILIYSQTSISNNMFVNPPAIQRALLL